MDAEYQRIKEEGDKLQMAVYIAKRKELSRIKLTERQAKIEERQRQIKEGLAYIKKNDVIVYSGSLHGYDITAGVILQTSPENVSWYRAAYCIKSPRDGKSLRVAKGLVGHRLIPLYESVFAFNIGLTQPGMLKSQHLKRLIETHILMDIVCHRGPIPARLYRETLRNSWSFVGLEEYKKERKNEKAKSLPVRNTDT